MDTMDDHEIFHFQFEADPCLYDSGKIFSIAYRRNKNETDCVENTILDYNLQNSMNKENGVLDALLQLYPDFPTSTTPFYNTATRITIETISGKLTATVTEDLDAIISYPPIPSSLSHVPTAPITELTPIKPVYMDVNRVKWRGGTYAFKRANEELEGTLCELAILARLANSPYIINLVAIVVNYDNTVRGFLSIHVHW